jgi:hypothetical protein
VPPHETAPDDDEDFLRSLDPRPRDEDEPK